MPNESGVSRNSALGNLNIPNVIELSMSVEVYQWV